MALYEPPTDTRPNGASNGASPNGSAPEPQRPPKPGGISMRPAMVVLGIATLLVTLFVVVGVTSSPSAPPPSHVATSSAVPGSSLRAEPAAGLLSPILVAGEPPTNVRDAVFVPTGSTRISHQDNSGGSGEFDAQVEFRSDASQAALLDFFGSDMKLVGWQVFDRGPAAHDPNAFEVLGKIAGTDGYYWEMGATVAPTTFGAGATTHGQTDFTIRLFQIQDE